MFHKLLRAKIHRATVTAAELEYVGSLTIDQELMDVAGILPHECVLAADLSNGTRHSTYAIPGKRGSGIVCVNGAAAPGERGRSDHRAVLRVLQPGRGRGIEAADRAGGRAEPPAAEVAGRRGFVPIKRDCAGAGGRRFRRELNATGHR